MDSNHRIITLSTDSPYIKEARVSAFSRQPFVPNTKVIACIATNELIAPLNEWVELYEDRNGICQFCGHTVAIAQRQPHQPLKKDGDYTSPRRRGLSSIRQPLFTIAGTALFMLICGAIFGIILAANNSNQSQPSISSLQQESASSSVRATGSLAQLSVAQSTQTAVEVGQGGTSSTATPIHTHAPTKRRATSTSTPSKTPQPATQTPTRITIPTRTRTPTHTATHIPPTPTKIPTRRPTPTPSSTPQPRITCNKTARGEFANLWQKNRAAMGCPRDTDPKYGQFADLPFQHGHLFWIGNIDTYGNVRQVIAKFGGQNEGNTGKWSIHQETWDNEGICNVPSPPEGLYLPDRGIAKVWCEINGLQTLGYATAPKEYSPDRGVDALQNFENAFVLRDSDGFSKRLVYIFYWNSMTYVRVRY